MKKAGILLGVIVILYLVLAMMGPSNYKVVRTVKIGAPIDVVYNETTVFVNWSKWSAWAKADTAAKYTIENDNQSPGAKMSWVGEIVGTGSLNVTEVVPNQKFIYDMNFIEPFEMTSHGGFIYTQEDDSVILEWYDEGDFSFMSRPMMLFMDIEGEIGPMFEQGLAGIKQICESGSVVKEVEISQETVESVSILYIEESSKLDGDSIGLKLGEAYGEIMALVGVSKLEMNGAPLAITTEFSLENMFWAFNAAIPVNYPEGFEVMGRIKTGSTSAGNVVKGIHVGSYMESINTYNAIEKYIKDNQLEISGNPWEEYVDDPTKVSPEELRTFIYFPIK